MDADAASQLAAIKGRIQKAQERFGPPAPDVTLVAVSKTFAADAVEPFLAAGQRVFGENRVQEAKDKWPALRERYPDAQLHLIGPLQTNKVREAVALFDVIQTVDREKLASMLAAEMQKSGRKLPCFVQVNIGGEDQKAGIATDEAVAFVARCRDVHGLDIVGLMCIPARRPAGWSLFCSSGYPGARRRRHWPVHGDERRFRDRHCHGRHPCSGRLGPVWHAPADRLGRRGRHARRGTAFTATCCRSSSLLLPVTPL
jgi:pyridoxal phosphate enzyme (YggS family)